MDRLQKKCWIASAGFHLSLALLLIVGPAFFNPKPPKSVDLPVLDFIPSKTVDSLAFNSGGPSARSAAPPVPTPPAPPVYTPPAAPAEKAEEEPKVTAKDTPKISEEIPRKPVISTAIVRRKPDLDTERKAKAEREAREEARLAAEARSRAIRVLDGAVGSIARGTSSATTISFGDGRG